MASSADSLSRLFAGLLVSATAGCTEKGIGLRQFGADICDEDGWHPMRALEPAEAVDFVQLRSITENTYFEAEDQRFSEPRVVDEDGELCGGASDPAACETAFAALPYESEIISFDWFGESSFHESLAYTRGDDVDVLLNRADLQAFLGDLDSEGDAALWAKLEGHNIVCGEGNDVGQHRDGHVIHTTTGDGCGNDIKEHVILVRGDGTVETLRTVVVEKGDPGCSVGRLPQGYRRRGDSHATNAVGRYLAQVAELEAASVPAFEQLTEELRVHRSPSPFVAAARAACADEVGHTAMTTALARRHGASPRPPTVRRMPPRDMVAMAADNAVEGCVRETYGALVAHAQARLATDPAVRGVMRTIARDETRHASLSWRIAQWAQSRMSVPERMRVARSARNSIEHLREELTAPADPRVHATLGVPEPARARAMFAGLHAGLLHRLEA